MMTYVFFCLVLVLLFEFSFDSISGRTHARCGRKGTQQVAEKDAQKGARKAHQATRAVPEEPGGEEVMTPSNFWCPIAVSCDLNTTDKVGEKRL